MIAIMLSVLLAGAVTASPAVAGQDVATQLAAVRDTSTLAITTRGRKTGNPHTVPVWFVVDGPALLLGTLDVKRDWVRNAAATPTVDIAIGTLRLRGQLSTITDPSTSQHFHELLAKKYWMAWAGSFFSKGPERAFRIDQLAPID